MSDSGQAGWRGSPNAVQAGGGIGEASTGQGSGGAGGADSTTAGGLGQEAADDSARDSGGGGGGVGWIRINTSDNSGALTATYSPALLSGKATFGPLKSVP